METAYIILNYKSWQETISEIQLIREILKGDYKDIIVIDNCSPNESYEKLSEFAEQTGIVLIQSGDNNGYAAGNNVGLRYAYQHGYAYGWVLNNDILFEDSELLKKILSVFAADPAIGVVNPDVYSPAGYLYNRYSVRPSFFDMTIGALQYKKKARQVQDMGGYGYIYRPQGCCMVVDLKKANEINYMDEMTFLYGEEQIYAERLRQKGYKCACAINSKIIHNHSQTVKSSIQKKNINEIKKKSNSYYLSQYRGYGKLKIAICNFFMMLRHTLTASA